MALVQSVAAVSALWLALLPFVASVFYVDHYEDEEAAAVVVGYVAAVC